MNGDSYKSDLSTIYFNKILLFDAKTLNYYNIKSGDLIEEIIEISII